MTEVTKTIKEAKPYISMLTASGYKYRCPNCQEETLTNTEYFYCDHCGYETEIHIPNYAD